MIGEEAYSPGYRRVDVSNVDSEQPGKIRSRRAKWPSTLKVASIDLKFGMVIDIHAI